jgi:hypothetical protein
MARLERKSLALIRQDIMDNGHRTFDYVVNKFKKKSNNPDLIVDPSNCLLEIIVGRGRERYFVSLSSFQHKDEGEMEPRASISVQRIGHGERIKDLAAFCENSNVDGVVETSLIRLSRGGGDDDFEAISPKRMAKSIDGVLGILDRHNSIIVAAL